METTIEHGVHEFHQGELTKGSSVEVMGGIAAVVLGIIGLAHVVPKYVLPIAGIVLAITLMARAAVVSAEYAHVLAAMREKGGLGHMELRSNSMSAEALAGGAALVLSILAILQLEPAVLMAVVSIVLGAGLLLGNGARTRLDALKVELVTNHDLAEKVADLESSGSAGAQALVGVAAVVLGILALVGMNPAVLVLVSMLAIGAATLLSGSAIESRMVNMMLGR